MLIHLYICWVGCVLGGLCVFIYGLCVFIYVGWAVCWVGCVSLYM
jgi:hypothetical protein